jgi:uncharacterized protein involved in type VI secretion and phage assembly
LSLADDRSFLKCTVSIFPELREIVARMSWENVGSSSGIFAFPSVNDLVLVAFADGDIDSCFVIRRLTSKEDKIPLQAVEGDTAIVSLNGKKAWISSDTRINLSKGTTQPTENLVLGQQLKSLLSDILNELATQASTLSSLATAIATHTHSGNLGYPTSAPMITAPFTSAASDLSENASNFSSNKSSPVDDSMILSDIAFTEKGN